MRFQIRFANQLVGIFVIVGVVFAVTAIVMLGTRQGWFEARHAYRTEVDSSTDLSVGMPVRYRGFDIGRVTSYDLRDRDTVTVDFVIFDRYQYLVSADSAVELSGNPLLGGNMVLHPGEDDSEILGADSFIPEWGSDEAIARRERGAVARSQPPDAVSRLLEDINPILDSVEDLLDSTELALTTVNRTLSGEKTDGPLAESFIGVNRLVSEAGNRLAESETLLARSDLLLSDVTAFSSQLREPDALIPRLVGTEGTLGALLHDDERMLMQIDALLTSVNTTIDELNQIAAFFGDQTPQLAAVIEEGRDALMVGQDVLIGLRNNPLLRRGIPERRQTEAGFESLREGRF